MRAAGSCDLAYVLSSFAFLVGGSTRAHRRDRGTGGGQTMVEAPHTGATVRRASIWRAGLYGVARPRIAVGR
jgi:hypothetical protein